MRIAFAGTPPFAACALKALVDAGHEVALVLTQPDRPSGRGMTLKPSAVKTVALESGIPVLTPITLSVKKSPEEAASVLKTLENSNVDVLVVAAYGLLLPERALNAARGIGSDLSIKSLNIHGSLLPRWRGAAPIQRAIEAGDSETGITLMKMDKGLDTGPVIFSRKTPIFDNDTALTLTERMTELGAKTIVEALNSPNALTYTPQTGESTYAEKILKTESAIDWSQEAKQISQKIRAFNPFPVASAKKGNEIIKIWEATATEGVGAPGEILQTKDRLVIACGTGAIECTKLQRAGKPAMNAQAFVQSMALVPGDTLK